MRKPVFVALIALALVFAAAPFALAHDDHGHDHGTAAAAGTWKGEIIDVACYVPNGAKGAGHTDCAKKCAQAGMPLGLVDVKVCAVDEVWSGLKLLRRLPAKVARASLPRGR